MGILSVTEQVVAQRVVSRTRRDACLVQVYPPDSSMGARYKLGETTVVLGRDDECDIRIQDHSVSRRHAKVELVGDEYLVSDLGSTNGSSVNDLPANRTPMVDGAILRVGNALFRFLAGNLVEAQYHEELYRIAIVDALTDLHNKRYLLEFLGRELARSSRHARPLALILLDIDHFKSINDSLGHLAGDLTLRQMAGCLKSEVQPDDLLARYEGEVFAAVLVEATRKTAAEVAERLRRAVESRAFSFAGRNYILPMNHQPEREPGSRGLETSFRLARAKNSWKSHYPVTISLGVATTPGGESLVPQEFIRRAEERLEKAKQEGRNRVVD